MRATPFLVSGLLIVVTLAACMGGNREKLPVLGHEGHSIPDFRLLNQDSVFVTNETFGHGVYIANFFFTHCPSICPTMQRNLLKVYERYKEDERVRFLSHSIDFRHDSPAVLKAYAEKLGVTNDHWQFVTGTKTEIYGLSDSYMVYTKEDASVPGGYDHSGYFLLVDSQRRIRGAYDGTNDEQVSLLLEELETLLKE